MKADVALSPQRIDTDEKFSFKPCVEEGSSVNTC